jgi:hypothetical protein
MDMSRFLQYIDECETCGCGDPDKVHKKKKKKKKVEEDYTAGKGGELQQLVNVLVGWPKDTATMIGYKNWKGALESLKRYKTKMIPDLEKAIKAEMKNK